MWSSFILGIAVWQGKFIYFPYTAAILLGDLFSRRSSLPQMFKRGIGYLIVFILPLLLWMAWLFLRFDLAMVKQWMADQNYCSTV